MAESSDEESPTADWVPYSNRPEWKDIIPLPQDDGPFSVVQIAYSDHFRDVYDYVRAILKANEKSERAFHLTTDAVELNPANYTVWQFRRLLLKELNLNLYDELAYSRRVIEEHPKNYQIWHHRRALVEWLKDASAELRLTDIILSKDAKNFHAWQYRQWVIKEFNLFDGELEAVTQMLEEDIRNNSAWNQRYYVITNTTGFSSEVIDREVQYCFDAITKVKYNESAWNFLRGVLKHYEAGMDCYPGMMEFCDTLVDAKCYSPHFLGLLIDLYEIKLEKGHDDDLTETLHKALQLCKSLATEHDKIRYQYWTFIAENLMEKYAYLY